jgi:hypothetical protein
MVRLQVGSCVLLSGIVVVVCNDSNFNWIALAATWKNIQSVTAHSNPKDKNKKRK